MKLPLGFVWVVLLIIVMSIFLNKTKPGRYIIAIGSNKEAARLSGVNVIKWHMLAYIICGFFTGLAGIAYAVYRFVKPDYLEDYEDDIDDEFDYDDDFFDDDDHFEEEVEEAAEDWIKLIMRYDYED